MIFMTYLDIFQGKNWNTEPAVWKVDRLCIKVYLTLQDELVTDKTTPLEFYV